MLALSHINPREFIKIRDFTRDLHGQARSIESRDALYSRLTVKNGAAKRFLPIPFGLTTPNPIMTTRGSMREFNPVGEGMASAMPLGAAKFTAASRARCRQNH